MSEVLAVRSEYRIQQWTQIIEECRCSGLSNREFCRRHDICEKTYCYWLRRVRKAAILRAKSEQPSLVPLENDSTELRDSLEGCLEIHFRGAALKLSGATDMDTVAALLKSIQRL